MRPSGVLLAMLVLATGGQSLAADIEGRLALVTKGGRAVSDEALADTVIAFVPDKPVPVTPAPAPAVIATRNKAFVPRVVAVTAGSRVSFPNEDPILHNVFSSSPGNAFDAGLAGQGDGPSQVLARPGVVRIFCNVHHSMVAYVVVLDTPFFVRPSGDGSFRLTGLPDGPGKLTAWHPRADPFSQDVALPLSKGVLLELAVTQKRVPPHLDKLGQAYDKSTPSSYE